MQHLKKTLRNNYYFWYYFLNRRFSFRYKKPYSNDNLIDNLIQRLRINGIAIENAENILPENLLKELQVNSNHLRSNNLSNKTDKNYAKFYLERIYQSDSVWAKIAEHPNIIHIAKAYFKMDRPRLVYYDLWENFPSGEAPKNAQLWHRDRDDLQILKIFIYLTDVDERTGAFVYAPGTHILGKHQKEPRYSLDETGTKRTSDDQMAQVVPETDWISGAGKKLSIVFADTHGFHKGGYVKEDYRFLYTCMYLSPYSGRIRFSNVKK
jgi:hypothetical protein